MHPVTEPRAINRSAVLSVLLSGQPFERNQIVETTGLSRATVFRIVDDLRTRGYVTDEGSVLSNSPGRPSTPVVFNGALQTVCGIDLGGTNCRLALADALGRMLVRAKYPTPHELSGPEFGRWMARKVRELEASLPEGQGPLGAVSIGVPGAVAASKDSVLGAHNVPNILGSAFIDAFREDIGVPATLDNDSNMALVGELQFGSLDNNETAALLTLGTGLGSAVALNGRVLYGRTGVLGEFGRLQIPGATVRLRDLVSGAGLVAYARSLGHGVGSASEILADSQRFSAVLDMMRSALVHLVSLVGLSYEPRSIVVMGGFADGLDDELFEWVQNEVLSLVGVSVVLSRTQLGDYSGLLGSIAMALGDLYASLGVLEEHIGSIRANREHTLSHLDHVPVFAG